MGDLPTERFSAPELLSDRYVPKAAPWIKLPFLEAEFSTILLRMTRIG